MMNEKTLTREEKTERIMEIYDKLDDAGKSDFARKIYELYIEQKMGELDKLIGYQYMPYEVAEDFRDYIDYKRKHPICNNPTDNELMLLIRMFNYGLICGVRRERARRRGIDF